MAAGDLTVGGALDVTGVVTVADDTLVDNLNADQVDGADKDTDGTLAGNSDASVPTEKAVKTYVDAQDGTHAALAVAGTHGSTVAATANKLIHRDAAGRAQIAAPSAAADIARKDTPAVGVIETGASVTIKMKVIEIGDWDMDADSTFNVAHGMGGDWKKIRGVSGVIRKDDDALYHFFGRAGTAINAVLQIWAHTFTGTYIILTRCSGETFDSVDYATPPAGNRGWLTIWYEE